MPLLGIEIVDFYRSYGVQDGYSLSLPTDVLFRAVFPQASPVSLLIPLPWGNSCAIELQRLHRVALEQILWETARSV